MSLWRWILHVPQGHTRLFRPIAESPRGAVRGCVRRELGAVPHRRSCAVKVRTRLLFLLHSWLGLWRLEHCSACVGAGGFTMPLIKPVVSAEGLWHVLMLHWSRSAWQPRVQSPWCISQANHAVNPWKRVILYCKMLTRVLLLCRLCFSLVMILSIWKCKIIFNKIHIPWVI